LFVLLAYVGQAAYLHGSGFDSDIIGSRSLGAFAGLLLAAAPRESFRSSEHERINVRQHSGPSRVLEAGRASLGRRAVVSAVPSALLLPGISFAKGGTIRLSGMYDDPQHPDCRRVIKPEGSGIVITGTDEIDGPQWKVYGKVEGDKVVIDFSPKGGPSEVEAQFDGDVESVTKPMPASLKFADGNVWNRLNRADLVAAVSYAGAYVQMTEDGKGALRRKVLTTGPTVTVTGTDEVGGPEWQVKGRFADRKLVIDFSSKGGPSAVTAVKTSKGLEFADGTLWKQVGPG